MFLRNTSDMKHIESQIQQSMIKWFRYQYPNHTIYAIPNGGRRGIIEAGIMRGEGVLSGVADIFLMHAEKGYHGLYVEVKTKEGKQSEAQKNFEVEAEKAGYRYIICRSLDDFIKETDNYLK